MLEALGLDSLSEQLYRAMLLHPEESVAGLARITGLSDAEVRHGLDHLSALSLLYPCDQQESGFRPLSPDAAVDLILSRRQSDLTAAQLRLAASQAAAARFVAECSALNAGTDAPRSEQLIGTETVRERLSGCGASAQDEVLTFAPGGAHDAEDLRASRAPNTQLLERGVHIRTIYLESVRNHQPTLEHVDWLNARGGEVRTAASLPVRMIIIDQREAFLPLDPEDARAGALLTRNRGMITALRALFELVWATAAPLGDKHSPDENGLTSQAAETISLLARGCTDEAIAKRLGVSPRTARRLTADLMRQLNARSRFEAGVQAVRRGWLPLRP